MKEYIPHDITERAKSHCRGIPAVYGFCASVCTPVFQRHPLPDKVLTGSDRTKVKVMGQESILVNKSLTDLRAVEQLTDSEQLSGLAALLLEAAERAMDGKKTLIQVVDLLEKEMDEKDFLRSWPLAVRRSGAPKTPGNLRLPEPVQEFEIQIKGRG